MAVAGHAPQPTFEFPETSTPMNTLEDLLKQASTSAEVRPAFYSALLAATVYVIGRATPGQPLEIEHWEKEDGSKTIPFFTSLDALQRGQEGTVDHLGLSGRELFALVAGGDMPLVLNPNSEYGKEFWLAEIQALLAQGSSRPVQASVVDREAHVHIGMPVRPPEAIIRALTAFFKTRPGVNAAYAGSIHDPADPAPNLLLGIDAALEGPALEQLIRQAGELASEHLQDDEVLDVVRVKAGEHGLSEYFLARIKPFYTRAG